MKTNRNRAVGFLLAVGFLVGSAFPLVGCGGNEPGPGGSVEVTPVQESVGDWGYLCSENGEKFVEFLSCELSPVEQEGYAMLTLFYRSEPETEIETLVLATKCRDEIWLYASIDDLNRQRSEKATIGSQGILIAMDEESFTFLVQTPDIIDWSYVDTEKTTVAFEDVRYTMELWVDVKNTGEGEKSEMYRLLLNYNSKETLPWIEGETPWIKD